MNLEKCRLASKVTGKSCGRIPQINGISMFCGVLPDIPVEEFPLTADKVVTNVTNELPRSSPNLLVEV